MKISNLEIFPYSFDLLKPIVVKQNALIKRQGYILKVTDELNHPIFTDIAPLPYFHHETLNEVKELFHQIKPDLLNTYWSLQMLLEGQHILSDFFKRAQAPSLQYALEMALLCFLRPPTSRFQAIPINALLAGADEDILEKAKTLKDYAIIKVKVSKRTPLEMLRLFNKLLPLLKEGQKLRIDINRSWNEEEAYFFSERFDPSFCDYLEEPLKNPLKLLDFSSKTSLGLAFDESLIDTPLNFLLSVPTKKAFIVKPALMGSLSKIYELYQKSKFHKLQFILTSAFESGLGHLCIAHLAQFLELEHPIGLDTYQWIKKDILTQALVFKKGTFNLSENRALNPYIDSKLLV